MLSKYFKNQKDQIDFFIAISVIALAGLFIGYYALTTDQPFIAKASDSLIVNPKVECLEVAGKTFVTFETTDSTHNAKAKRKKIDENSGNNIVEIKDSVRNVTSIASIVEDDVEEMLDDEIDENTEIEIDENEEIDVDDSDIIEDLDDDFDEEIAEEIVTESEAEETADENEELATIEDSSEEVPPVSATTETNSKKIGDCIIVIGAFGNERNIKNLIGKLDYKGYPIFKVPFNGLTRVGVYEDCVDAEETLQEIKNKYSPDAFILKAQ